MKEYQFTIQITTFSNFRDIILSARQVQGREGGQAEGSGRMDSHL